MKSLNLLTLTAVTAAIALPMATYADTSLGVRGGTDLNINGNTAVQSEKLGADVGVGAGADVESHSDAEMEADQSSARTQSDTDLQAGVKADFSAYDQNRDGAITRTEFKASAAISEAAQLFTDLDSNNDGRLDRQEFALFSRSRNDASGGLRAGR
jgi:hypothetical protein